MDYYDRQVRPESEDYKQATDMVHQDPIKAMAWYMLLRMEKSVDTKLDRALIDVFGYMPTIRLDEKKLISTIRINGTPNFFTHNHLGNMMVDPCQSIVYELVEDGAKWYGCLKLEHDLFKFWYADGAQDRMDKLMVSAPAIANILIELKQKVDKEIKWKLEEGG